MYLSPFPAFARQTIRRNPDLWAQGCGVTLRYYQKEIALAIADSIIHHRGLTFVILLPRQSGKNEVQAHLFAWLLFRSRSSGGRIVSVSPTFKPQTLVAMQRVRRSLESCPGSRGEWKPCGGYSYTFGKAALQFFSGAGSANVVGATADLLLSVDEAQSVSPAKFDRDFDPMTASTNATRVFWGTAWTADTLLDRERRAAERAEASDGIRRFFHYTAEDIRRVVPAYGAHVDRVIAALGRSHPVVRTQYYCENVDSQAGMFPPARLALIFPPSVSLPIFEENGDCAASRNEVEGGWGRADSVAFLIDVGGADEQHTNFDPSRLGELSNPQRDSTTLTIVGLDLSSLATLQRPTYRVLQRLSWTGESHLTVFGALQALAAGWNPQHIVLDSTGVGEGLWSLLEKAFPARVIPVHYTRQRKSEIGWRFLAIIESGRFSDPTARRNDAVAQTVRLQYARCISHILPGPGRQMRWGVPEGTRGPEGERIHDDHLMADSLVAVLDKLDWQPFFGGALIIDPPDPMDILEEHY